MKNTTLSQQFDLIDKYNSKDPQTAVTAAQRLDDECFYFYDWFCKASSLKRKFETLVPKVRKLVEAAKIDKNTHYFWLKNNCLLAGGLYDDFRISDCKTGDNQWVCQYRDGRYKLFNHKDWHNPVATGTFKDILSYFDNAGSYTFTNPIQK